MPGTNGFEVAKRMRTEYPDIKRLLPFYGRDIAVLVRDIADAKLNKRASALLTKRELEIIEACLLNLLTLQRISLIAAQDIHIPVLDQFLRGVGGIRINSRSLRRSIRLIHGLQHNSLRQIAG